jgi:hypothetical protein
LYLKRFYFAAFLVRVRNSFVEKALGDFASPLSTKLSTVIVDNPISLINPPLGEF